MADPTTPQSWQTPANTNSSSASIFTGPPKLLFTLGIMVGVAAVSLLGFLLAFSAYRNAVEDGTTKTAVTNTNSGTDTTGAAPTPTTPIDVKVDEKNDWIIGNKNAKVTVVEFSDFECPFCSRFKPVIDQVLTDYKDKVRVVYKHYPLSSIHPNAQKAAEAAECAGAQKADQFWAMHDKLFANNTALSVASMKTWAKELGLNESKFASCMDNSEKANDVKADQTYGDTIGVSGTPTSFVNGYIVSGAQDYSFVKNLIDQELAKS